MEEDDNIYFFLRVTIIIACDLEEKTFEAVAAIVLLLFPSFRISIIV